MAKREREHQTRYHGFNPGNVNPDRVGFEEETLGSTERIETRYRTIDVQRGPSIRPLTWGEVKTRFRRLALPFLVATAALNIGANVGTERRTSPHAGHEFIEPNSAGDFIARVNNAAGGIVDVDLIHRFITQDAAGRRSFNPGGFVSPLAVGVTTERDVDINLEVAAGQTWAQDFETTELNNPERVQELRDMIVAELLRKYPQHISIRGLHNVTNTTGAWNAHGSEFGVNTDGSLAPQTVAGLALENMVAIGSTSDEASSAADLGTSDAQNESLALIRANNLLPTALEALRGARIDPSQVESIELQGIQNILTPADIGKLAEIAQRQSQWDGEGGTTEEWAQRTIEAYNRQPGSLTLVDGDAEILQRNLDQMRNARLVINARGTEQSFHSLNIVIPLPLLLLLLGLKGVPGGVRRKSVSHDVVTVTDHIERTAVKRRLFSEKTPATLNTERDFNEVYDSIDLNARGEYERLHSMWRHMLMEEIRPSLNRATREPYIDYLGIANKSLPYMHSDTLPARTIRKGRYPTSEEAQREVALELLREWEHHDQAIYPMEESPLGVFAPFTGSKLDTKKALNYEHSEYHVTWAKLVAEQFVAIHQQLFREKEEAIRNAGITDGSVTPIITRDEFEAVFRQRIANVKGYVPRDVFVVSAQPDGADYGPRMY